MRGILSNLRDWSEDLAGAAHNVMRGNGWLAWASGVVFGVAVCVAMGVMVGRVVLWSVGA